MLREDTYRQVEMKQKYPPRLIQMHLMISGIGRGARHQDRLMRLLLSKASRIAYLLVATLIVAPFATQSASAGGVTAAHTVTVSDGHFVLDGNPVQIISGEMHYPRIPRPYWRDRLLKAKAMGLNAVTVYAFWNVHEPHPGQWDFSGQYDVAQFIRTAQEVGLYVILRPGPYVCGEWSFGGYPNWLLKDPKMQVRSLDPSFMKAAREYMSHLGQQLKPLLWTNGGPIIAVQVENEYGSYGKDKAYLEAIKQMDIDAGLGSVVLYTGDGPGLWNGTLPELPAAIDIGPGDAQAGFKKLLKFRPNSPLMYAAEFYPGWFDQWGKPHSTGAPIAKQLKDLNWILSHGYSMSLYMFHGGTDWGFMNGANASGKNFEPQTTSYDYSAPLNEAGDPTPNYYALRDLFHKFQPLVKVPAVPSSVPLISVAPFKLSLSSSLWDNLPAPRHSEDPLHFEDFELETGYLLYRTRIRGPVKGMLDIGGARDYAVIYLDGQRIATLDRRLGQHETSLDVTRKSARLDILVEDTGRINFGSLFATDRKGLIFPVLLNGVKLQGWDNYSFPMASTKVRRWSEATTPGPAFHRGTFDLSRVGDTYLDVSTLGKGLIWVNGHAVGRVWNIGPQQSDYVPGCWLHKGRNTVTVFDIAGEDKPEVSGKTHHVYALRP
jgi:beta-galactosidase